MVFAIIFLILYIVFKNTVEVAFMFDSFVWENWAQCVYIILAGIILEQFLSRIFFPFCRNHFGKKLSEQMRGLLIGAIETPIKFIVLMTAFYLGFKSSPLPIFSENIFLHIYRSTVVISISAILYNCVDSDSGRFKGILDRLHVFINPILIKFLGSALRFFIAIICFLMIAKEWGYDINGFIAGLGLGGLALAMASKDSLSNIFGGLIILTDKPFGIGDIIVAAGIEGTVVEVNFRSTKIRTSDQGLVYVPNSNLTNIPIVNKSAMQKRRYAFTIGLTYNTKKEDLQSFLNALSDHLNQRKDISQQDGDIFIAFTNYGKDSLDIDIIYHTLATGFAMHSKIKEDINFAIMDISEKTGVAMAFASQSIYFENSLIIDSKKAPN